jgi:hypothetical protein
VSAGPAVAAWIAGEFRRALRLALQAQPCSANYEMNFRNLDVGGKMVPGASRFLNIASPWEPAGFTALINTLL